MDTRGAASAQHIVVVACVALVGVGGFGALGGAMGADIAGGAQGSGVTVSTAGTARTVSSVPVSVAAAKGADALAAADARSNASNVPSNGRRIIESRIGEVESEERSSSSANSGSGLWSILTRTLVNAPSAIAAGGNGGGAGAPQGDSNVGPSVVRHPEISTEELALGRGKLAYLFADEAPKLRDQIRWSVATGGVDAKTAEKLAELESLDPMELLEGDAWDTLSSLRRDGKLSDDLAHKVDSFEFGLGVDAAFATEQRVRDAILAERDKGNLGSWLEDLSSDGAARVHAELEGVARSTIGRREEFAALSDAQIDDARATIRDQLEAYEGRTERGTQSDRDHVDALQSMDFMFAAEELARGNKVVLPPAHLSPEAEARINSSPGEQAVDNAMAQLGKPYVWGADGPTAFDCSGLMVYSYAPLGVSMPRVSRDQYSALPKVAPGNMQPGDLVFFGPTPAGIHHVGMYIGDGKYVHAPHTGDVVKVSNLSASSEFIGAARPW
ncbi:MAG: C40 family peptidase [Polyangiales bacterium]|nr:C40 family peptidase [Myxococcales bacterium]